MLASQVVESVHAGIKNEDTSLFAAARRVVRRLEPDAVLALIMTFSTPIVCRLGLKETPVLALQMQIRESKNEKDLFLNWADMLKAEGCISSAHLMTEGDLFFGGEMALNNETANFVPTYLGAGVLRLLTPYLNELKENGLAE
jgi:hypothetical protein